MPRTSLELLAECERQEKEKKEKNILIETGCVIFWTFCIWYSLFLVSLVISISCPRLRALSQICNALTHSDHIIRPETGIKSKCPQWCCTSNNYNQ